MTAITDLIEDWIQMRSTLQRQLKMLESSEMYAETLYRRTKFTSEGICDFPEALKASAGRLAMTTAIDRSIACC